LTGAQRYAAILYSESNSRFLVEVPVAHRAAFEQCLSDTAWGLVGEVGSSKTLRFDFGAAEPAWEYDISDLKEAWQSPLRW
jgi:hypothetical protein